MWTNQEFISTIKAVASTSIPMSILESPYKYIPPTKYSEFEDICLAILTPVFKTPFTLLGNRDLIAKQHGVDLFGRDPRSRVIAVQAKLRNSKKGLTFDEIEREIEKARNSPLNARRGIREYIIATTARADGDLQCRVERLSSENIERDQFSIRILFWDNICRMLDDHPQVARQIYPWLGNDSPSFLAGERLLKVRTGMGLSRSELVSLCYFNGERQLERLEKNEEECGLWLLTQVALRTGASFDWLQHGREEPYKVERLYFESRESKGVLTELQAARIDSLTATISEERKQVGLIVRFENGQYQALWTNLCMDFHEWMDDTVYFPDAYCFLETLRALQPRPWGRSPFGRYLTAEEHHALYSGQVHPMQFAYPSSYKHPSFRAWTYHPWRDWLLDFTAKVNDYPDISNRLYGEWFGEARRALQKRVPRCKYAISD
jgi:transcriptional regulator with XRE-family HTH domain